MKISDLGEIQGDMLLFGGIYSNLEALKALLLVAKQNNIPAKNCICTGDIVAYCADAEGSVNAVRAFSCPVLAGNCEVQLSEDAQDCGCGFEEGTECSILSRGWYAHAVKQVSDKNKLWMGSLPDRIVFTRNARRYAVIHGGATDIARFIWPVTDDATIAAEISTLIGQVGHIDHIIASHSGIPMQRVIGDTTWTNIGAIGMPCNNGSSLTCYGYLIEKELIISELEYDSNVTISTMKSAGLIQGYQNTLQSGYWPSQDILPPEMRHQSFAKGW